MDPRPGLYVHIPFCSAVCPYCDFAVVRSQHPGRVSFVDGLTREIELVERGAHPHGAAFAYAETNAIGPEAGSFSTIYFGGGTPSALAPEELQQIQAAIRRSLSIATDARWSIEANPEDINPEALKAWTNLGFDYLSLGVQSFYDPALKFLGRRHTAGQARDACALALKSDFSTVSIDLMMGFECLTQEAWEGVLTTATELGPHHLSCYELTIHEGTSFWRRQQAGTLGLIDEEARATAFRSTVERLSSCGYEQYEVSNFARREVDRSPHNQKYWQSIPYLGVGPGAHSYDGHRRWWNHRALKDWSAAVAGDQSPIAETEELTAEQQRLEWLLTRVRTTQGLELAEYRQRFGRGLLEEYRESTESLVARGLLRKEAGALKPTLEGLLLADSIVMELS